VRSRNNTYFQVLLWGRCDSSTNIFGSVCSLDGRFSAAKHSPKTGLTLAQKRLSLTACTACGMHGLPACCNCCTLLYVWLVYLLLLIVPCSFDWAICSCFSGVRSFIVELFVILCYYQWKIVHRIIQQSSFWKCSMYFASREINFTCGLWITSALWWMLQ